ncbi:MAG: DUF4376 domain-containing protein [Halomonas sp.]|nr:DUF4376 domain-containing protein [Halomonas sp.]MCC5882482.1 DUF4376 domain-containing protein [Halomonas sp.]
MRIWDIHPTDGTVIAPAGREAPLEPMRREPRIPAGAINIEPPSVGDHQAALWNGEDWKVVPDYRGHVFWTEDGKRHEITELGVELPEDALDEAPPEPLADLAGRMRAAIDTARDQAFAAGFKYHIAGEEDVVQTRGQDQTNLLGIAIEARELHAAGVNDAVIEFRGLSNINRALTPKQAIDLTNAASEYIKEIYQRSWNRKDAIDAALANEDRAEIEAVTW